MTSVYHRAPAQAVAPPLTSDEVERRIASFLRISYAYRMSPANARALANNYLACMRVAHRELPSFDFERAVQLGRRPPARARHGKEKQQCNLL